MEAAAGQLRDKGFVWFDCNMGCSVPKVARTGSGAAMCKDIDNALSVAEAPDPGCRARTCRLQSCASAGMSRDVPPAAETWRVLAPALEALGAGLADAAPPARRSRASPGRRAGNISAS